jgi:hypothetical protein
MGWAVINSFISVDEATFTPRAVLYRSGSPIMEVPLLDFSGNPISLTVDFFENGETVDQEHHGGGHQHENAIVFNNVNVFLMFQLKYLLLLNMPLDIKSIWRATLKSNLLMTKTMLFLQIRLLM